MCVSSEPVNFKAVSDSSCSFVISAEESSTFKALFKAAFILTSGMSTMSDEAAQICGSFANSVQNGITIRQASSTHRIFLKLCFIIFFPPKNRNTMKFYHNAVQKYVVIKG